MSALLVIDVGNTNTVVGVYDSGKLRVHWRIRTDKHRTGDEYAVLLTQLFGFSDMSLTSLKAAMVASVVPPVRDSLERLCSRHLKIPLTVVGPGVKTGMPILCDNPREIGADRIVNAVAAFERYKRACIAVDFGTATTWDVVTSKGEYSGGVIAPGIRVSAEALYQSASKLPRVEFDNPGQVIGRNTVASMKSGIVFGYAGMVDSMVSRICYEVGTDMPCIATGGLAPLIAKESKSIAEVDELLTLQGLFLIFTRNEPTWD